MTQQLDYIYFVSGFIFFYIAVSVFKTGASEIHRPRVWRWIGLFGVMFGIHEWLAMILQTISEPGWMRVSMILCLAGSLFALGVFAWVDRAMTSSPGQGRRGYIVALVFGMGCWLTALPPSVTAQSIWGAAMLRSIAETFRDCPSVVVRILFACCMIVYLSRRSSVESILVEGSTKIIRRWVLPLHVAVFLVCGWLGTEWQGRSVQQAEETKILTLAANIAQAVPPEEAAALSFLEDDRQKIEYKRLKRQLIAFQKYTGHPRSIYSVGLRDSALVFGPDAIVENDPFASKSGSVYKQPPPELKRIFGTAQPMVLGPFTDEFGSFVAAYAPVIDKASQTVVLIIGMDIPADEWRTVRIVPIVMTMVIVLLLVGGFELFAARRRYLRRNNAWWYRNAESLIPACIGLLMTVFAVKVVYDFEMRKHEEQVERLSAMQVKELYDRLQNLHNEIAGLARFFESSVKVNREGFEVFTQQWTQSSGLQTMQWVPQIRARNKKRFEADLRRRGRDQFVVFERNKEGQNTGVADHGTYFPVAYVSPLRGNESLIGFDCASSPVEKAAIDEVMETRLPVATTGIRSIRHPAGDKSVMIFHPVFKNRDNGVAGLVLGVVQPQVILDKLPVIGLATRAQMALEIVELDDEGRNSVLAHTPSVAALNGSDDAGMPEEDVHRYPLFMSGRVWAVVTHPLSTAKNDQPFLHAGVFGLGGLLLTSVLIIVVQVITRRKDALEGKILNAAVQLNKAETRFRNLFELSPDPHLLFLDTQIVDCNDAAMAMLKGTREQLLGLTFLDLSPRMQPDGASTDEKINVFRQQSHIEKNGRIEWLARKLDGTLFWAEASHSVLMMDHQVMSFLELRDISGRKKIETDLERSNYERREAVIRTNEMAVRAEAATMAKNNFLSNMSHEIRTPMNGVIGFTELLIETPLNEEQRSYAELVRSSALSLMTLIDDILDFSKMEKGTLELDEIPFDLQSVLDEYATMCGILAHAKGLDLVCMTDSDVPILLKGDQDRLRQVLVILTQNAVKFTTKGDVAIRVSLLSETKETAVLRFSVCDTGIGIAEDKQRLLFQPFSQVDGSYSRKYNGSGLGLVISKQLVTLMNGEIGVFSVEGRGSEFWFTIRVGKQPECNRPEPVYPDILGRHVLVADPNAANRMMLVLRLRSWGARVEEISDGASLLEALHGKNNAGEPYHVLLLDVDMIGMAASAFAEKITAAPGLSAIRLILMVRQDRHDVEHELKDIRAWSIIKKPIAKAKLLECLIRPSH